MDCYDRKRFTILERARVCLVQACPARRGQERRRVLSDELAYFFAQEFFRGVVGVRTVQAGIKNENALSELVKRIPELRAAQLLFAGA